MNGYMSILLWVVIGIVAGWLASVIMGTNRQQGILMDLVMGVIGAVAGGFIMNLFGADGVTGFNVYSLLVATLGAVVVIWLYRQVAYRT